jgi:hypothetical protein
MDDLQEAVEDLLTDTCRELLFDDIEQLLLSVLASDKDAASRQEKLNRKLRGMLLLSPSVRERCDNPSCAQRVHYRLLVVEA